MREINEQSEDVSLLMVTGDAGSSTDATARRILANSTRAPIDDEAWPPSRALTHRVVAYRQLFCVSIRASRLQRSGGDDGIERSPLNGKAS